MARRIRINNIEYRYNKANRNSHEIVKWQSNPYYGKHDEYIQNGYVESFGGDFLRKEGHSIQKTFFTNPESCFVIAFISPEIDDEGWELRSVGNRILDLNEDDLKDFFQVYRFAVTN